MFKHRTLFVVGAGASNEFGLPTGAELASRISDRLDIKIDPWSDASPRGDVDLFGKLIRRWPGENLKYNHAAWRMRDGVRLSASIDDFLDVHGTNEYVKRVGKSAIAKTILEYERGSSLFVSASNINNKMDLPRLEGTWLMKLMRTLSRGRPIEEVDKIFSNVAFIVFNYDRCIEQFFYHALQLQYAVDRQKAGELVRRLDLIHPYGAVGKLPMNVQDGIFFGSEHERVDEDYALLSESIRTYTEQIDDKTKLDAIRSQVDRATNIVFLGFAFHDQNLALLKPEKPTKGKNIYGTAFGMSESDVKIVSQQLTSFMDDVGQITAQNSIHISTAHKCSGLFDFYGKSLPN